MRPLDRIPSLFVRKQSLLIFNNAASGRRTPHIGIADGRGWAAGTQCATHRAHGHAAVGDGRARARRRETRDRERVPVREFSRTRTARGAGVRPPAENKYAQARRPGARRADNARKSYTATMDYEMQ